MSQQSSEEVDIIDQRSEQFHVAIIGAGIGGLATALRLAAAGYAVTVVESADHPGGKIRTLPSAAGPVDTGPTVLTMKPVFEALFADAGERLDDHLTLHELSVIARHYWEDGTQFDLTSDRAETVSNVRAAFGSNAVAEFEQVTSRAARLFEAFDAPMMKAADPSSLSMAAVVAKSPRLILDMAPLASLARMLDGAFTDRRLAQLFGRYATYVGGSPQGSPALLALISEAEARGVWSVEGGMGELARTIAELARAKGARFLFGTEVQSIEIRDGRATGIVTGTGRISADAVVFNGDPRAIHGGLMGDDARNAVPAAAVEPRSLSAWVHAFAARPTGPDLAYHTVFFGSEPNAEFVRLDRGQHPSDATLYVCAQDRATAARPDGPERFEIILNGVPSNAIAETEEEVRACQKQVFDRLAAFGLTFDPVPGPQTLSSPTEFARLFPASKGSLYGRSPHGLTAGLKRPRARTTIQGLYLCGGGAHPGAGVPMATLSGRHAAEAIGADLASLSKSRPTAMPGGMSTGSRMTASAQSRS
ncbi:phytoene desaturase [Ponticoccus sp. SC2-23]|uniref:1-hydroxycarotenoid 3,4-desaturase CrtD n=1 Tax=Alexandriicola marinus TaxID=2081710 RepID=UPI000FD8AEB0|nr:1-hydroxycarotenoid 3,4-desaturase CrtD [Alexandriicola marinus]MBM1221737.1 phytoene desaturase [Ponticoccus sp. SC6-9]MBM1226088.1 phytoene desaturase [Ponticoccus sp. SC6-15]MBM1230685.1 phytoene desaturase [Ponticoccus sp. SC6-38]MBM1235475.1 phytoene desaturase [Ponticoccus sp. SC6-45]MBM1239706.1 phytoene desaturase [Ponticoccus sp. SC6-49]MBM1243850.1 phytoene desaturase [Ponticoccus sp. SC2-64]MBM1248998.1 phytoene desaturase [Ponticoccus sp. SC6-42]MBM1253361.1 phytoene desatura